MNQDLKHDIDVALRRVPTGMFVICAEHEDRRTAMLASWVQQVCNEPPMISLAVGKGTAIMPLISESRQFGLCQLGEDDRLMMRKFSKDPDPDEDPFLSYELLNDTTLSLPLLKNTLAQFECTLVCHMDVEGDHDLFIGQIRNAARREGNPYIHLPSDTSK
jgi:flavin reductase (DIM6/NTAB) family NADH-FMN oxidoreductase RutF